MKQKFLSLTILSMITFLSIAILTSCSTNNANEADSQPILSEQEKEDLLTLREEEKLARDVYLYAYDKYNLRISKNISGSEQRHMDEVLEILNEYGLEDPAASDTGVFNNTELQKLYDILTAKVDSSLLDALIVGAIIEDLDIKDILDFKSHTSKADIIKMYDFLECGSRNHLRAYSYQILQNGGDYTPQYISETMFDSIVNSDKERCGQIYR